MKIEYMLGILCYYYYIKYTYRAVFLQILTVHSIFERRATVSVVVSNVYYYYY